MFQSNTLPPSSGWLNWSGWMVKWCEGKFCVDYIKQFEIVQPITATEGMKRGLGLSWANGNKTSRRVFCASQYSEKPSLLLAQHNPIPSSHPPLLWLAKLIQHATKQIHSLWRGKQYVPHNIRTFNHYVHGAKTQKMIINWTTIFYILESVKVLELFLSSV